MWNRRPVRSAASSLVWVILLFVACQLVAGCPQIAQWRDKQIEDSAKYAAGSRVYPPDPPIEVPRKVAKLLPLHENLTVLEFKQLQVRPEQIELKLLSAWDTERTAVWLYEWLTEHGYSSDNGPSSLLSGDVYRNQAEKYREISVNVTENTANQCIIAIRAQAG